MTRRDFDVNVEARRQTTCVAQCHPHHSELLSMKTCQAMIADYALMVKELCNGECLTGKYFFFLFVAIHCVLPCLFSVALFSSRSALGRLPWLDYLIHRKLPGPARSRAAKLQHQVIWKLPFGMSSNTALPTHENLSAHRADYTNPEKNGHRTHHWRTCYLRPSVGPMAPN
jgi:hypothetical protein